MANKVSFIIELQNKFSRTAAKVKQQFEGINQKIKKVNRSLKAMSVRFQASAKRFAASGAKIGGVMTAAVTVPILMMGNKLVDAASNAEETANKFNEVFKGIEKQSSTAVKELTSGFDLATSSAQEMLSNTGDLLVGLGLTRSQALELSSSVVKLSADVASFKNVEGGAERAAMALTKALLGEKEMLKDTFKVAVLDAEVKKRAIILGRANRKLTEQQAKALATLAIVTERSKDAIGDLSRTQDAYANVQRKSQETSKELSEAFGKLLLPMAVKFQRLLIKVANVLNNLSPGMKKFILILAGVVAIGGPLLLLLAGIAAAIGFISLPVLLVGAAIAALVVGISFLAANWDEITAFMSEKITAFSNAVAKVGDRMTVIFNAVWDSIVAGIKMAVTFALKFLDMLTAPMRFITEKIAGLVGIDFKFPSISEAIATMNSTPVAPAAANGTVSGEIVVSATAGAQLEKVGLAMQGTGLDIGMNMVELR